MKGYVRKLLLCTPQYIKKNMNDFEMKTGSYAKQVLYWSHELLCLRITRYIQLLDVINYTFLPYLCYNYCWIFPHLPLNTKRTCFVVSDSKWGNGFKQTVFLLANIIFYFEPIQSFLGGRLAVHFLWRKLRSSIFYFTVKRVLNRLPRL